MAHPREASFSQIRLSGRQRTSITVHASQTPEAVVAFNVGHFICYTHDAEPLMKVRNGLARINLKQVPRGVQPLASRAHTISSELHAEDAASAQLIARACGVPEVGPGSLTSGDRRSDMIPTCRCGCCT